MAALVEGQPRKKKSHCVVFLGGYAWRQVLILSTELTLPHFAAFNTKQESCVHTGWQFLKESMAVDTDSPDKNKEY